jgi:hypothetical protein
VKLASMKPSVKSILPRQTQVLRQAREQVTEDAVLPPLLEPPMAGLLRRVAIRQVTPRRAGAQDPQHPVEHRTRVALRAAAAVRPPLLFEQRLDDRPLRVGQVHARAARRVDRNRL